MCVGGGLYRHREGGFQIEMQILTFWNSLGAKQSPPQQKQEGRGWAGENEGRRGETARRERERPKERRERGEGERGQREEMGTDSRDDESASSKSSSPSRQTINLIARHTVRSDWPFHRDITKTHMRDWSDL